MSSRVQLRPWRDSDAAYAIQAKVAIPTLPGFTFLGTLKYCLDLYNENKTVLKDGKPQGIISCFVSEGVVEPHGLWYPWSSARTRYAAWQKYVEDDRPMALYPEEQYIEFFKRVLGVH